MPFPFSQFISEAKKGGHSDEFIQSTVGYAKRLDDKKLPVIFSLEHFASLIGMPSSLIKTIIQYRDNQYSRFFLQKKNGRGVRLINVPDKKLMFIQGWINKNILQQIQLLPCCTAFVPGTSLATNGYIHRNSYKLLKVDLLRFFDTINERRVFGYFKYLGYHPNVAFYLAQLTTTFPSHSYWNSLSISEIRKLSSHLSFDEAFLPQGSPSSPQLANCIASSLDYRLDKLSKRLGCRYSRYADDLIFSIAINSAGCLPSVNMLRKIIKSERFIINDEKTVYQKRGMKQYVTGLTVTHGFHVPKKERQEIYKHLFYARKYGPYNHLAKWMEDNEKKQATIYNFYDWLLGKISFIYSIDYKNGKKMFEQFNQIIWTFEDGSEATEGERADLNIPFPT